MGLEGVVTVVAVAAAAAAAGGSFAWFGALNFGNLLKVARSLATCCGFFEDLRRSRASRAVSGAPVAGLIGLAHTVARSTGGGATNVAADGLLPPPGNRVGLLAGPGGWSVDEEGLNEFEDDPVVLALAETDGRNDTLSVEESADGMDEIETTLGREVRL